MDKNKEEIPPGKIKKENPDEDIKEFAETAMNELLGWYGYGANSDREDSKISTRACRSNTGSNSSEPESPKYTEGCQWCGKPVDENKGLSSSDATFCSELCFSHSRRANFKKNKTCDWCRHVRHTVSYVDFQDGVSQLQFCSDKCLNQYKMHIFCRETRAHLDMHPHLPEEVALSSGGGGGLITPDLWLKNCKSADNSNSPSPDSPKLLENLPQTSPLPLLTVVRQKTSPDLKRQRKPKKNRKRSSTVTSSPPLPEIPQDLRVRHTPPINYHNYHFRDEEESRFSHFRGVPLFNNFPPSPLHHPQLFNQPPPRIPCTPQSPPPGIKTLLPPVTVLVPYPIIIPLPLPIPIPIPVPLNCDSLNNNKDHLLLNKETKTPPIVIEQNRRERNKKDIETTEVIVVGAEEELKPEEYIDVVNTKGNEKPFRKRKRIDSIANKPKIGTVKNKNSVSV